MKVQLFRANSGDWEALYVDGKLHRQGHSIDSDVYLDLLGGSDTCDEFNRLGDLEQWGNRCPDTWEELEEALEAPDPLQEKLQNLFSKMTNCVPQGRVTLRPSGSGYELRDEVRSYRFDRPIDVIEVLLTEDLTTGERT